MRSYRFGMQEVSIMDDQIPSAGIVPAANVGDAPEQFARQPGTRLLHNRNFNIFWAGQTLSAIGDAVALIAIPLLVLRVTGSIAQMGLVTATVGAGTIIAGIIAGPIADRVDRRRFMIGCDLVRMGVYAIIPIGWWLAGRTSRSSISPPGSARFSACASR